MRKSVLNALSPLLWVLMALPFVVSSCIRDDRPACPTLTITLAVKDKNYFNVDVVDLEERVAENLPFRHYVPTIYYVVRDAATGQIVEESALQGVEGDGQTVTLDMCDCIEHGRYIVTVWGGMATEQPLTRDPLVCDLTNGDDIYMAQDTIDYTYTNANTTLYMERAKGKLIVQFVNLPDNYSGCDIDVSNLSSSVDCGWSYSGVETSTLVYEWQSDEPTVTRKAVLAPSVAPRASEMSVHFLGTSPEATRTIVTTEGLVNPRDINITMERNMLTVVRYEWNAETGEYEIYALLDNSWARVDELEIE